MTKIARTPTYSREATRETSFHGLAPPHFSGAFEPFGHASRRVPAFGGRVWARAGYDERSQGQDRAAGRPKAWWLTSWVFGV